MTRTEIRDLSRKKLGETTAAFWTDTELNNFINFGCKDVANRVKCLRSSTVISSVSCVASTAVSAARSNEYTISNSMSNFFAITEMSFMQNGTSWIKLKPTSREELDAMYPGWRIGVGYTLISTTGTAAVTTYNYASTPGVPTHYYWDREEDYFGLYPPPDNTNAGSYIKAYFTYNHTDLSADASSPTLPQPLHLAVVEFVVATGLETRGWGDRANDSWQKYFSKINDYQVERKNEREDDEIIMKNYRNL